VRARARIADDWAKTLGIDLVSSVWRGEIGGREEVAALLVRRARGFVRHASERTGARLTSCAQIGSRARGGDHNKRDQNFVTEASAGR